MKSTVVVGVEGTTSSQDALLWAAEAAHRRGWDLVIVTATGFPTIALDVLYDDGIQAGARNLLEKEAERATAAVPGIEPRIEVDRRTPALALVERSWHAGMVVVGSHRLTALERVFSGSLGYQVAAAAHCPVVIVPRLAADDASGIVVGADGSADSLEAIALAAAEADSTGQELHVVHAWQEPAMYVSGDYFSPGFTAELREAEAVILGESVAGLAERFPDLVIRTHLTQEQPATALLDAAAHARLVVVGSRGRHGVARTLLGSVSHTVVLHAPCPVMVARIRAHIQPEHL